MLYANGDSLLQLRGAKIDNNSLRPDLGMAEDNAELILMASILDDNTVANRSVAPATSSLFAARYGGVVDVRNSTIIMRSALTQFFRLGWQPYGTTSDIHGIAYAQASAFASTVGTPRAVEFESARRPAISSRYWCGFFRNTTTNFGLPHRGQRPDHRHLRGAGARSVQHRCELLAAQQRSARRLLTTPAVNHDFNGHPYDVNLEPASAVHADIGAVEAQLVDAIFSNGFET